VERHCTVVDWWCKSSWNSLVTSTRWKIDNLWRNSDDSGRWFLEHQQDNDLMTHRLMWL